MPNIGRKGVSGLDSGSTGVAGGEGLGVCGVSDRVGDVGGVFENSLDSVKPDELKDLKEEKTGKRVSCLVR